MKYELSSQNLTDLFKHVDSWKNSPTYIEWIGGDRFLVVMENEIPEVEILSLNLRDTDREPKEELLLKNTQVK